MTRYAFRLATVLRVRRAEEERDRSRLLEKNRILRELIEVRDHEQERYGNLRGTQGCVSFEDFRRAQLSSELAAKSLSEADRAAVVAASHSALAQVEWLAASRRVEMLERLEERYRTEHTALVRKADMTTADDFVTARHVAEQLEAAEHAS